MFAIDDQVLLKFFLSFIRIGALLFAMPFFGEEVIKPQIKALLAIALTISLHNSIPESWGSVPKLETLGLSLLIVKELLLGLSIGYLARVLFEGMIMAASFVGYQMGLVLQIYYYLEPTSMLMLLQLYIEF